MRSLIATFILSSLAVSASTSYGEILSFEFTATVYENNAKSAAEVGIGDTVTGSFYYSTLLPDTDPASDGGSYEAVGDPTLAGISFTFGSLNYTSDLDDLLRMGVSAWPGGITSSMGYIWYFDGADSSYHGSAELYLQGPNGHFVSDDLPSAFSLDGLLTKTFEMTYDGYYVKANLTSITAVPEPNRALLLTLALGTLVLRRRRRVV